MQALAFIGSILSPISAQSLAARNLEMLAAIENAIDVLVGDTDLLHGISRTYGEIQDRLSGFEGEIDPSGHIVAMLEKASAACVRIYHEAQKQHQTSRVNLQLHPDDGVTDAYEAFVGAVHELHDTIEALREWVAAHDAVLQPATGQVFDSVDDLFESLLAGK